MAARKNPKISDAHREKIQTSQLINRLENHALGKNKMTVTQVRAAEILLRKTVPDLKAIEHTGNDGGAVTVQIVRYGDNPLTK